MISIDGLLKKICHGKIFFDYITGILFNWEGDNIIDPFDALLQIANEKKSPYDLTEVGRAIMPKIFAYDKTTWKDFENLYRIALALKPDQRIDGVDYNKRTKTFGQWLWQFNSPHTFPQMFEYYTTISGPNPLTADFKHISRISRRIDQQNLAAITPKELNKLQEYYKTYIDTLETDYYPEILLAITSRLSFLQMIMLEF